MEEKKAFEDKVTEIHAVDLLPRSNLSNYSKKQKQKQKNTKTDDGRTTE